MPHLHRFYCPACTSIQRENEIDLIGTNGRHIKDVLRMSPGDCIKVFDGEGTETVVCLTHVSKKAVTGEIVKKLHIKRQTPKIILGQAIPRQRKIDFVMQKGTELGLDSIVPIVTQRTSIKSDENYRSKKCIRWRKIAEESACQSGRVYIPEVSDIISFEQFLSANKNCSIKIILWEKESRRFRTVFEGLLKKGTETSVALVVGPEGGFSEDEVKCAMQYGFMPASLGPQILRTETVSLCVVSIIQYLLGNIG